MLYDSWIDLIFLRFVNTHFVAYFVNVTKKSSTCTLHIIDRYWSAIVFLFQVNFFYSNMRSTSPSNMVNQVEFHRRCIIDDFCENWLSCDWFYTNNFNLANASQSNPFILEMSSRNGIGYGLSSLFAFVMHSFTFTQRVLSTSYPSIYPFHSQCLILSNLLALSLHLTPLTSTRQLHRSLSIHCFLAQGWHSTPLVYFRVWSNSRSKTVYSIAPRLLRSFRTIISNGAPVKGANNSHLLSLGSRYSIPPCPHYSSLIRIQRPVMIGERKGNAPLLIIIGSVITPCPVPVEKWGWARNRLGRSPRKSVA